ncbi:MAG: hypothetical protein H0W22_04940 [Chloroflexi bacterium]|nr:hypothetical protein [Chloroflexota bacterium]
MTDDLHRGVPGEDTYETETRTEPARDPDGSADKPEENPWLKEGADAPDAADIEDPAEQR